MAYGVTDDGFILKRLQDILTEQRALAVALFQDLVASGDIVDTGDSSLLGRLINLDAPGDADLWEAAQQVYSAFDPNSATGIALDNLVAYTGISRFPASPSTAIGLFVGDLNTLVPAGSTVSAPNSNVQFDVSESVALSPTLAAGIVATVGTVQNNTAYTITYTPAGGSASVVTYTSDASATVAEILAGLAAAITGSHPLLDATAVGSTLVVDNDDVFQSIIFAVSSNLLISKVKKTGTLTATANGALSQEANTITNIVTPVLGWDSITNPLAASEGRLAEADEELRLRFRNTKLERSSNILDSLYSALLNIDGVEEVAIYENDTDAIDSNGVQPHSFLPIVLGGSSQLIAETIWLNKPIGILSQGTTVVTITDSQGFPHDIGLQRPDPVTIYVEMEIEADPEAPIPLPGDAADQIKAAIISYADSNIGVGKDVIFSRMYTPINTVPGHQINSLFIGTTPSPVGTSNITIAFDELASFESANIVVNIV
ncbi:hypothetical protein D3C85_173360 [compost metagenome]